MGSPALTPALALRYLDELSTDVHAAVVLDPDGALAASRPGDGSRGERLRELTLEVVDQAVRARPEPVGEVEVTTPAGAVFVARSNGWTVAAVTGRFVLSSLMRYDLRRILDDLGNEG